MTTLRLVTKKRTPGKPSPLGERLAWLLELTGLSGRELAGKAGVSHALVGQIVRGENKETRRDKIEAFARAADVDPGWLLTGAGEPRPGLSWPGSAQGPAAPPPPPPSGSRPLVDGRWRLFAALHPQFGAAATEALDAGASERLLDAASDRLAATAPDYSAAVEAIVAASRGAAAFRAAFLGGEEPGAGSLPRLLTPPETSGKVKSPAR